MTHIEEKPINIWLTRGGILGVRCGEIMLISSSILPGLGRVNSKNVNKLTDLNAAVSSPGCHSIYNSITTQLAFM